MATKTSRVPNEDWMKHKATILELYCEKGLPLTQGKNAQDERRCVDWVMKCEHGFSASKSQYEAQLRLWGATKNLKQSEWVSLLTAYDRLQHQGQDVRIVISGKVQTGAKIDKARYRYLKRTPGVPGAASLAQPVTSNHHSFVEVKEGDEWIQYRGDNSRERSDPLASGSNAPRRGNESHGEAALIPGTGYLSPHHQSTPHRELAVLAQSMEWGITPGVSGSWDPDLTCQSMSGFTINTFGISPGILPDRPSLNNELMPFGLNIQDLSTSPRIVETSMQDGDDSPPAPTYYSHSHNRDDLNASNSSPDASMEPQMSFDLVLRSQFAAAIARNPTGSVDARGSADRFMSLLSDASIFWHHRNSSILVQSNSATDHALFNTLLYSIINGFAGLEEMPHTSVLGLLRENRMFYSHMSKLLITGPDSVAKPIVDNLLPAAIQAGDFEAVTWLLQATADHPSFSIDLEKSVFHVPAGISTPLELAVKSGSAEVVRVILEAGADPNRKTAAYGHRNMLSLVLSLQDSEDEYPALEVVRLLLDHGAEIDVRSIEDAVDEFAQVHLVLEELVQRLPASQHATCFLRSGEPRYSFTEGSMHISRGYRNQGPVEDMVQFVDKSVATSLVKKLVQDCMSTNCINCTQNNPDIVNSILLHAARRGNLELVIFLAQYTTSLDQALTGAVKSGNCDLIAFLLENGARADGPPVFVEVNRFDVTFDRQEPSTPLAEAIRQGDEELVHSLADYGAWRRLDDRNHLEAAINAAAEVGNVRYLEAVLCRIAPAERLPCFALPMAIACGSTPCALALLTAGAPTHLTAYPNTVVTKTDALSLALQMRNKDVAYAILDCGVPFCNTPMEEGFGGSELHCTMELAGQWGDKEIIDAVASMGANLDAGLYTTALAAAVAARNRQLVDHVLDLGADPGAKALIGRSPLGEAVNNKDHSMIDYLLSRGATPADTSAFLTAMECDQVALTKLSSAFKQKYPLGLKGFGNELIAETIRENNTTLLSCLLDLKIDLARLVPWHLLEGRRKRVKPDDPKRVDRLNPLGFAILHPKGENTHLVELLMRSGAPVNAIAAVQGLLPVSSTPLHLAVSTRRTGVIDLLLNAGANLNLPARRGVLCTPLQEACKIGSYDLVEFLLQKGADVNSPAARRRGGTALQFAARGGSLKMVELLLLNEADPHAPGSEFGGGTAFELAAEYGRYHVLFLLWNKAPRDGFTAGILRSARDRAERNGRRGCVDFIANIIQDASFGRLVSGGA